MPRALRKKFPGAKYHVTARGNGKQRIFFGAADYQRFIVQLQHALDCDQVILYAYVLMPNHYHLLVETPLANIDRFAQRLNTAYSLYFRYKHKRPGHVLQGRYGGKLVKGDRYLSAVTRYLHLNPVKTDKMRGRGVAEQVRCLERYRWSSYRGYVSARCEEEFVDYRWRELVGGKTAARQRSRYRRYVAQFIAGTDEQLAEALARSAYVVGNEDDVREVETELRQERRGTAMDRDVLWPRELAPDPGRVDEVVAEAFGVSVEDLHLHGRKAGRSKGVALELCCRLTGLSQRQVAEHYGGMSCSGVTYQRRLLRKTMRADLDLADLVSRLQARLLGKN